MVLRVRNTNKLTNVTPLRLTVVWVKCMANASYLVCCCHRYLTRSNLKKPRFILVHGFRRDIAHHDREDMAVGMG